ncbi:MAG TPA: histone deacetylase [Gemmatimonadales bacterium]|nr:histone deacetylase [Gemmatimonadales bacterium]
MTVVFTHERCLDHDPGPGHPETAARLATVMERVRSAGYEVRSGPVATPDLLAGVHPPEHAARLRRMADSGGGSVGLDTVLNGASWEAALAGLGQVLAAVEHAHAGRGNAFAAVRPPGHHALTDRAMGFCLIANAVVAARHAQRLGRERVLIVDWDVHHGNGTQALVEQDPTIRFVSMHQWPWYPGTGAASERGVGNVFNIPRPPGLPAEGSHGYVESLWEGVEAAGANWTPDLILLSAGYDGMTGDPLGGFTLEPGHYAGWTTRLRERFPAAPVVGLMEGGYAPARLADGVLATVRALT